MTAPPILEVFIPSSKKQGPGPDLLLAYTHDAGLVVSEVSSSLSTSEYAECFGGKQGQRPHHLPMPHAGNWLRQHTLYSTWKVLLHENLQQDFHQPL